MKRFFIFISTFISPVFFSIIKAQVHPEFPTGNGKIDLLIRHAGQLFGLELKSFANIQQYQEALTQAATYGKQLGLYQKFG
jgi:predicted type IV restriction endonuclease